MPVKWWIPDPFSCLINLCLFFKSTRVSSFADQTFTDILFFCFAQIIPVTVFRLFFWPNEQSYWYLLQLITSGRFYELLFVPVYFKITLFLPVFLLISVREMLSSSATFHVCQFKPAFVMIFFCSSVGLTTRTCYTSLFSFCFYFSSCISLFLYL